MLCGDPGYIESDLTKKSGRHLLYASLHKLPESPGVFSEVQLRWINGHYPEDFVIAARARLAETLDAIHG